MRALPLRNVELFEKVLESVWARRRYAVTTRRDALIVGLGLCGLRWIEVERIRVGDFDLWDASLMVRTAKGGRRRTIDLGKSWMCSWREVYNIYCGRLGRRGLPAFPTRTGRGVQYEHIRRHVRHMTRRVLGTSFSFHCLRHTAAVRVYEATHDVVAVQRYLGHASLQHTTTYLATVCPARFDGTPGFTRGEGFQKGLRVYDPERRLG